MRSATRYGFLLITTLPETSRPIISRRFCLSPLVWG